MEQPRQPPVNMDTNHPRAPGGQKSIAARHDLAAMTPPRHGSRAGPLRPCARSSAWARAGNGSCGHGRLRVGQQTFEPARTDPLHRRSYET
jgi:hypothetical protein